MMFCKVALLNEFGLGTNFPFLKKKRWGGLEETTHMCVEYTYTELVYVSLAL
jgi:hypothetical protein